MSEHLRIGGLVRRAVADAVAPAVVFSVARGDEPPTVWFAGRLDDTPDAGWATADTRFDLASLTKPLTTAQWCLRLVEAGRLELEAPLGRYVGVTAPALAACPVWRLLAHSSGLAAHRPYYSGLGPRVLACGDFAGARRSLRRMLLGSELEYAPGQREVYSDLGFMLLEAVCEAVDAPLEIAWRDLPGHGDDALHFRPLPTTPSAQYAATERCPWRGRLLVGEVHDDNCWVVGGVAGHAGLFGDVRAVDALARRFVSLWHGRDAGLGVGTALLRSALDQRWGHPTGTRVLGWDTPTPGSSSAGRQFGQRAFGHLGFTGTSVWIDPEAEVVMVLLTNRVCPSRENQGIRALRPALHDAGWGWIRRGSDKEAPGGG